MRIVYLDNNATTKVAPEVLEAMKPFFTEEYGNPSSMHTFGGKIHKYIDAARESIADFLAARDPNEIIFTSCGTESDSTAIMSILRSYPDKRHIITTKVEHAAVFNLCKYLETVGYRVTYLNVDNQGMINLSELENSIDEDTAIISVMYANNETGVIFPIKEIAEIAKTKGVIIHTDAVQAAGKVPFKLTYIPGIKPAVTHYLFCLIGIFVITFHYVRPFSNYFTFTAPGLSISDNFNLNPRQRLAH